MGSSSLFLQMCWLYFGISLRLLGRFQCRHLLLCHFCLGPKYLEQATFWFRAVSQYLASQGHQSKTTPHQISAIWSLQRLSFFQFIQPFPSSLVSPRQHLWGNRFCSKIPPRLAPYRFKRRISGAIKRTLKHACGYMIAHIFAHMSLSIHLWRSRAFWPFWR